MNITSILWLMPFSFFLAGYLILSCITHTPTLETPQCIGRPLQQALSLLSACNLTTKIREEKEDDDIPAGTIIDQRPTYKQKIKPHQTVYLVVSKTSKKAAAPLLLGKNVTDIASELKNNGLSHKNYPVPSAHPHDICIAQLPIAGEPLYEKKVITYTSAPTKQPIIFPDLTRHPAAECIAFLEKHGLNPTISHTQEPAKHHVCSYCTIIDQKPLAGSIVPFDSTLLVQLLIEHK
jgi:beta-lactam-binding protein with PASTA domain